MKKSLYFILFATLLAQIPSEVMGMKREADEQSGPEKKRSEKDPLAATAPIIATAAPVPVVAAAPQIADPEAAVAAAAPKEVAADSRCGVCMCDFDKPNEDDQIVKQIKLVCCNYTICEKCLDDCLRGKEAQDKVCPQCREPIANLKILKDKVLAEMMRRKVKEKRDKIKKEQDAAREAKEAARIQEQIRRFSSGEDITAYVDVPADTTVDVAFISKITDPSEELRLIAKLPILHFLAKGGPDGHDEFKDAFELVKYFVEEKGANINQKVRIPDQTYSFCGTGTFGIDQWIRVHPYYNHCFVGLTPLEIAETYGTHSIAEYLRGKIKEQTEVQATEQQAREAAEAEQRRTRETAEQQARETAERHAPSVNCAVQ